MNVPATVERRQDRAIQLANIARCHLELGSTDRALALFHESLAICRDIGDRIGTADALDGIGSVHHATGDKDEAFAHYQEALRTAREISEHALTCQSLRNIGVLHAASGDYRFAVSSLEESLSVSCTLEDPYERALTLAALGECLPHVGRAAEGREHANAAAFLMRSLGIVDG